MCTSQGPRGEGCWGAGGGSVETAGAPELTRLSGAEAASRGGRGGGPEASAQRRCPRPLLLASLPCAHMCGTCVYVTLD